MLKRRLVNALLASALAGLGAASVARGQQVPAQPDVLGISPVQLRVEAKVDPLGVDSVNPRLSWIVASSRRGEVQTAYQIVVATDEAKLAAEEGGDLWDSGKVASDETTGISYSGVPLKSGLRCVWKVRIWGKDGNPSGWSAPAFWTVGLLDAADWKAEWIGHDKARDESAGAVEADFGAAKWIWHGEDKGGDKPKGHRLFVTEFEVAADSPIAEATLLSVADDSHKYTINGQLAAAGSSFKVPVQTDVARFVKPGKNTLRAEVENGAPSPAGLLARLVVKLKDGRVVESITDPSWKTVADPGANWHDRAIDLAGLPAAEVVGAYGDGPWGKLTVTKLVLPRPAYLRKDFQVDKPVKRATLYTTALGIHDAHVNGVRVADDYFNPGWTDYTKRVYYRTYDVTRLVRPGANALGAILADGWYSGYVGFGKLRDHYGKKPRLKAQLVVEHADGSTSVVATGPDWKAAVGPILEADFLMGETYDARLEKAGWDQPGYDASAWAAVDSGAEMDPKVEAHPGPPVLPFTELRAKTSAPVKPGVYVLDYGRNFAGVPRLRLRGEPGQAITLRFAERLNPDGSVYVTNLREARCIDTYVCKGTGEEEVWSPRFTFHGYQYLEVSGLKSPPTTETVVGLALSSATAVAGRFQTSDPMLNQLHSNIYWTQRANFIDIPTDCPQRDERLGWTGDAQVYIKTASLNADVQAFFDKWLVDLTDGQRADGQFPMVAPVKVAGDDGGPAWAEAGVVCPWTIYQVYNDKRLLERQYPSMAKYVEFQIARSTPDLLPPEKYHAFGDWLSIGADTPKDVIYSAYFALAARTTSKAAEVLGKAEDAKKYADVYEKIKASFNRAYVAEDGRIKGDTQACYVLALSNDLVDGEKAKQAAEHLVKDIEAKGWHLSTGFVGTKDLMLVLSKIGRQDVAYRLLFNDTFPSWGFSIRHGATSIWERWDGWTPDKGFQDPGMNSFAHYSFGAVYGWIVENIGGIHAADVAYKRIVIAPKLTDKLTFASTSYRSVRGDVAVAWTRNAGVVTMDVTIPANTTAKIAVPAADPAAIAESGVPLAQAQAQGVKVAGVEEGATIVEVGSGRYVFTFAAR
ncbi:family 78 glycoside hydrolase catalytic domain [Paludisphaera mucosa]|uniref:alpha-L-rhamnosidase n=1 Tax=Paludisphaera mucosa TaxID=3030827 RepID=A0ABT6FK56_9BACT|nr:family 78 glycoside hydrolase catalytic domain [Paludisphaera mucosa]MDG3007939.1 family 78 glycoside hydrolase catalytic domain [Paludisphaera mucosa]